MRLMTLQEFGDTYFSEKSRPSESTLRRCCPPRESAAAANDSKEYLPGRWVGGRFYVDADAWEAQDEDPIVQQILLGHGKTPERPRRRAAA